MFVDFFIRRPIFATVCAMVIVLGGAVAIPTLPIAQFPNLAPPQVIVTSAYNGADAQTVESAVTIPLERSINGVEGLKYLTSTSGNNGVSTITATFDVSRDPDLAAVDVQNRVQAAAGLLPAQVNANGITITKGLSGFVFAAAFYSDNNKYSGLFISNYVDVYVSDAIKRVPGVANVTIFGQREYAMRVWLDPAKLAARRLTATDVIAALQEQNVQVAAGQIGQPPAPAGQAFQISVRAMGQLTDPAQFDNIILKTGANGTLVRVKDVGYAELGAQDYSSNLFINGHEAIGLAIQQLPNANALQVDEMGKEELEKLAPTFPAGLKYGIAFDTTTAVSEGIRDVIITLIEAIVLVIAVIFIFLQDWRSTFIPAITIPVSLVGTFIFVKLLGFSINTLTMFGITLATGLVVDDAIVVIENVQRHISEGLSEPHRAASVAMGEVAGAVVATSLVLISVFVPVALFPGTTGILFRQFALTIAFSVAISAFNALTLTPALSAIFLGHQRGAGLGKRVFAPFNRLVIGGTNVYRATLHRLFNWKFVTAVLFLILAGLTYWVFNMVPRGFVPAEDDGYIMILVQAPPGASLEYTSNICHQIEAILRKQPETADIFSVAGFSFSGAASNYAMVFVNLKPFSDRKGEAHSALTLVNRLRGPFASISGASVVPFNPPAVQGLGQFGGFQFEVEDQGAASLQQLQESTQALVRAGNQDRSNLTGLFSSFTANDPQFVVNIDRGEAKSLNVPLSQITDALQVYLGSVYVNNFTFNNRSYRVYVQAAEQYRSHPDDIDRYYVRSNSGNMVSLDNLVSITQTASPQVVTHYDLFRSAEIDGSAAAGRSSGDAISEMQKLAAKVLPRGFSYEWSGLSLEEIQSGSKSAALFGLGLLVVYLTLAAQYESFTLPFIVIMAVPMAMLGALLFQSLRGNINDVYCQIGLVMLIGLASKNAILIVEFAEQLREKGMSLNEAAIEAARIRLRPILMTSFAFLLGVLPLVLATGAGAASRSSVGTTVFGGMIFATSLNLLFIPVLYVIVKGVQLRRQHAPAIQPTAPEPES
ncbi:MAG TPA: multidrug efflux RND transporter permease subunit [Candidatus Acidoferrales bacterium]|nr:multidrug efflux RND transporter permease subunit [Candidatus Acidoferrales bacterium]